MALEAELIIELELPVPMTCSDSVAIPKGSILEINDPSTVTITNGASDKIVGIAATEKIANDGKTTIAVYLRGIFRGTCGAGGATVGRAIRVDSGNGVNELVVAAANEEGIVGTSFETATDLQTFKFLLNPINPVLA